MEVEIVKSLQKLYSDFVVFSSTFVSYLSSWVGFVFVLICLLLFCKFRFALTFGITAGIVSAVVNIMKVLIKRLRPFEQSGEVLNLLQENGFSMPSGHTANAVVMMVFFAYWIYLCVKNKWVKGSMLSLCGIFIICVMLSRIFLGQHFLSDVCAGFGISAIISIPAIFVYHKYIRSWVFKRKKAKPGED